MTRRTDLGPAKHDKLDLLNVWVLVSLFDLPHGPVSSGILKAGLLAGITAQQQSPATAVELSQESGVVANRPCLPPPSVGANWTSLDSQAFFLAL
ncbi:MAG TPA: hypothetical protein VN669_18055 [Candidatus Acidoferrales bacterium]|nr:hypothetical protein [Candidatus Acidoferrales bacterium]